ncbi:MAG: hypothetical protein Q8N96_01960 [Methylovulum sp.]|nr:hypothetical protein [Methylovulum sp.]
MLALNSKQPQYIINKQVVVKKIGDDFVAFNGLSSETILLNPLAYEILICLSVAPSYSDGLTKKVSVQKSEVNRADLDGFVDFTLREFVSRGFVFESETPV